MVIIVAEKVIEFLIQTRKKRNIHNAKKKRLFKVNW